MLPPAPPPHKASTFGSQRYARIWSAIERSGIQSGAITNEVGLYVNLCRALGLDGHTMNGAYTPGIGAARRALVTYMKTGKLVNISEHTGDFDVYDAASDLDISVMATIHHRSNRVTRLFVEQQGRCHYCSRAMLLAKGSWRKPEYATVDHVVPKADGGKGMKENTVAACADCNSRKGAMAYHLFKAIKSVT